MEGEFKTELHFWPSELRLTVLLYCGASMSSVPPLTDFSSHHFSYRLATRVSNRPSTNQSTMVFSSFDRDSGGKISAAELRLCDAPGRHIGRGRRGARGVGGRGGLSEEEFLKLVAEEGEEEDHRRRGLRDATQGVRGGGERVHHVGEPEAGAEPAGRQPGRRRVPRHDA